MCVCVFMQVYVFMYDVCVYYQCVCVNMCECLCVCVSPLQVGPQPVLTIPDDPRILGAFDLNHFSLRIMSVDYQACSPGPSPSPSGPSHTGPAPRLSFCEDSRVVMGDWGSFAYVQHLTLYDLEARGFVRPFCMAYVSAEHRKLMEHFLLLSEGLGQASDWLKTGNRRAFARELTRKLLDLE